MRAPLLIGRYSPAHIKEVRRALEIPVGAALPPLRRTDHDVGQLAALLARMEDADDPARRNKLDADFHIAIAQRPAIALFVKLIEDLRDVLEEHSLALARRRTAARPRSVEHTKIYEAICRRDPDAAGAAMAEHLDSRADACAARRDARRRPVSASRLTPES